MQIIPIFTTRGEHAAFYSDGYLFNTGGEWIGFVDTRNGYVYALDGEYVGYFAKDGRILRKRSMEEMPKRTPPAAPKRLAVPTRVPLPPLLGDLTFDTIDVLEEMPERLHTIDSGELKEDMD